MNKIIPSNVTIKLLKQKETIFKVARGKKEHYILEEQRQELRRLYVVSQKKWSNIF